jgi:hypothetical protein
MDIFKRFGKIAEGGPWYEITDDSHSVVIQFNYPFDELDELFALDQKLDDLIEENQAGMYDGHEVQVDGPDARLYMYGPNAETLLKTILPVLKETDYMKGATAMLRFGGIRDRQAKSIDVVI